MAIEYSSIASVYYLFSKHALPCALNSAALSKISLCRSRGGAFTGVVGNEWERDETGVAEDI